MDARLYTQSDLTSAIFKEKDRKEQLRLKLERRIALQRDAIEQLLFDMTAAARLCDNAKPQTAAELLRLSATSTRHRLRNA